MPPGVFSRNSTASAFWLAAWSKACVSRATVMGWITPSMSTVITLGAAPKSALAISAARQTGLSMWDTPLLQYRRIGRGIRVGREGWLRQGRFIQSQQLTPGAFGVGLVVDRHA